MVLRPQLGGDPQVLALEALLEDGRQGFANVGFVAIHGRSVNVLHTGQRCQQLADLCRGASGCSWKSCTKGLLSSTVAAG